MPDTGDGVVFMDFVGTGVGFLVGGCEGEVDGKSLGSALGV
jgi:hypothetical protein